MRASGLALFAAALLLAGCGGNDRRDTVDDYLERVDRIEHPVLVTKGQVDLVLGRFRLSGATRADLAVLDRAETSFRAVARKLSDLEPPREARGLHRDIVRLFRLQAEVVQELTSAARYSPRLARAVQPLRPASERLAADLKVARQAAATERAFATYRGTLEDVLRALEPLRAPPSLQPSLAGQRRALTRSASLCREIEKALRRGNASGVESAAQRLASLSSDREAARTRRAEIAAAKAFNRRLQRIAGLARKIERDRRTLDAELD